MEQDREQKKIVKEENIQKNSILKLRFLPKMPLRYDEFFAI
jgi:hypothetical protein